MAAEIVTTSLTINFKEAEGVKNQFLIEVDDRLDGPNKGKTSFSPGSTAYLLLFAAQNITSINGRVTSGSLASGSALQPEREELIQYPETTEWTPRYPMVPGSHSIVWYGAAPPSINVVNGVFVVPEDTLAVGLIKYRAYARSYSLSAVPHPAAIVFFSGVAL